MCVTDDRIKLSNNFIIKDLYVEITNQCNLYCKYCCRNSNIEDKQEMQVEIFDKLLSDAKELECCNVTLSGGEAILHHQFEDIFQICIQYGYNVTLLTNGIAIERLSCYSLQNINRIQISVDGGKAELNDKTRGNGTFCKITNCISYLLSKGVTPDRLSLKMTVTHENIQAVEALAVLAAEYNINDIGFSFLYKTGRAEVLEDDLFVTKEDRHNVLSIINSIKSKYTNIKVQMPAYTNKCPFLQEEGSVELFPRIDCEGKVYACQLMTGGFWIGNIVYESLKDILEGKRFFWLRALGVSREEFMEECEACKLKKKCGRGCLALSLFEGITSTDGNCGLRNEHEQGLYHMVVKWLKDRQIS